MSKPLDENDDQADAFDIHDMWEEGDSDVGENCPECGEPTISGECQNQLCPECPDYVGDDEDDDDEDPDA